MLSVGPFSATVIVAGLAIAAAIGAAALAARRRGRGAIRVLAGLVMDMTLVGFVAARLGFVLAWWSRYMADPWSVFYIGDGGFLIWAGALASAAFGTWRVRKLPALRAPLGAALLTGWLVWFVAAGVLSLAQRARIGLPDVALTRLDGATVRLAQISDEPMVVNLWATWCAPCRREMPMLAAAQARHPAVTFVFVNQRQGRAAIRDYLDAENLQLANVLLDPRGAIARRVGSGALPTTLFYDADGDLVASHVGMLSAASLAATLQQFDLPAGPDDTPNSLETPSDA